jgi:DNA-binding HxlR family transcriptional regulator
MTSCLRKVSTHINVRMKKTKATRFRKGDLMSDACPSREVLKHLTSRWGVLALMALQDGTYRFSELRRKIGGVSDGMVDRIAYPVVPPHVEYRLTPLGQEGARRVQGLAEWIEESLPRVQKVWGAQG